MNKPRYVLHPGYVRGPDDFPEYVSALQLARCYRVSILHCVIAHSRGFRDLPGDIHLHVKSNGNYVLPNSKDGAA